MNVPVSIVLPSPGWKLYGWIMYVPAGRFLAVPLATRKHSPASLTNAPVPASVSSAYLTVTSTVPPTVNAYTVLLSLPGVSVEGSSVTLTGVTPLGTYDIEDIDTSPAATGFSLSTPVLDAIALCASVMLVCNS